MNETELKEQIERLNRRHEEDLAYLKKAQEEKEQYKNLFFCARLYAICVIEGTHNEKEKCGRRDRMIEAINEIEIAEGRTTLEEAIKDDS